MWTYVPSDVSVSIVGVQLKGFVKNTFVRIEPDKPTFTHKMAMDGSVSRKVSQYKIYKVTITLQASSPSNGLLDVLNNLIVGSGGGFIMPMLIRSASGTSNFFSTDCWIEGNTPLTFSDGLDVVEWVFYCNAASITIGGNIDDDYEVIKTIQAIQTALAASSMLGIDLGSIASTLKDAALSLGGR